MRLTPLLRWLLTILGGVALLYLLYLNQATLLLLSLSFVLAYLLDPIIDYGEQRRLSRTLAITLLITALVLGLGVFFLVFIPQLQRQASQIVGRAPGWVQWLSTHLAPLLEQLAAPLQDYFGLTLDFDTARRYALQGREWVVSHLPSIAQRIVGLFQSMFTGLANFIVGVLNILLMPVLVFYLLRDFDILQARFYALLPPPWRPVVADWLGEIDQAVGGFVRGQCTIAVILAVVYAIGLALVGVPLGAVLGIVSGLANLVPYMSIVAGLLPALVLYVLSEAPSLGGVLGIVLIYVGGQVLEGVYLSPRIMGRETGLHPVVVMVAIMVGGTLLGLIGIIVAVPGTAIVQVALRRWHTAWQATWPASEARDRDHGAGD